MKWMNKWIMIIISLQWNLVNKQFLKLMCWRTKLWWLHDWVRAPPKQQVSGGVPSRLWPVPNKNSPRKDNQWTSDSVMGTQDSMMCLRSEAQISSNLNAGCRQVSEHTVQHSLLCVGMHMMLNRTELTWLSSVTPMMVWHHHFTCACTSGKDGIGMQCGSLIQPHLTTYRA